MADYIDGVHKEIRETRQQILAVQQSLERVATVDYAQIYGIFRRVARAHDEQWPLPEELDVASVDFFKSGDKLETLYRTSLISGTSLTLGAYTVTSATLDNCESLKDWSEAEFADDGKLDLDTQVRYQGNASLKVTYTKTGAEEFRYRIKKTLRAPQDWSDYVFLRVWVRGSSATNFRIRLCINEKDFVSSDFVVSGTGWVQLYFDISACDRSSVTSFGFQFTKESVQYSCNLDQIELVDARYYGTGYAISRTVELSKNVEKVYLGVYDLSPAIITSVSYDLSLDGGSHWKTNVLPERWLSALPGGALETPDSGSWSRKDRLKIKFNLSTTDSSYTAELDDYILMWKLED